MHFLTFFTLKALFRVFSEFRVPLKALFFRSEKKLEMEIWGEFRHPMKSVDNDGVTWLANGRPPLRLESVFRLIRPRGVGIWGLECP